MYSIDNKMFRDLNVSFELKSKLMHRNQNTWRDIDSGRHEKGEEQIT